MDQLGAAALAGLLHDIGKLWQRTGQRHSSSYNVLTPNDYGAHGAHAKWSAEFVERFVPAPWRAALPGVLYHHRAQEYLAKVVAVADWLSSGEREEQGARLEDQPAQLRSLFSRISLDGPPPDRGQYRPLVPLAVTEAAVFPRDGPAGKAEERSAYERLWAGFVAEHAEVPEGPFDVYFETLYYLLQKHTWAVPSAFYRSVPDVSLFDHARTTAAIAAALVQAGTPEAELDGLLRRDSAARQASRPRGGNPRRGIET